MEQRNLDGAYAYCETVCRNASTTFYSSFSAFSPTSDERFTPFTLSADGSMTSLTGMKSQPSSKRTNCDWPLMSVSESFLKFMLEPRPRSPLTSTEGA